MLAYLRENDENSMTRDISNVSLERKEGYH